MTAFAPALVQSSGTDPAGRRAHLLVKRDELRGEAVGRLGSLRGRLLGLRRDLGERAVASLFGLGQRGGDLLLLGAKLGKPGLNDLALLHDLELFVLEVGLPLLQGPDLVLEVLELTRGP